MNYYTQTSLRLGWSVIIGVITPLMMPNLVEGASLRTRMTNEGYLSFQHDRPFIDQNGKEIRGEERTGWTDIRHPALDGTLDRKRGYDWSDNQVMVLTHNVQVDPPKGPPGDSTVNGDLRRQDFNVANAIYAQAGISILQEGNMDTQGNDIVPVMGNNGPSLSMLFANDRSKNANTVNQYYVDNIPGARGQTIPPQFGAGIAPPSGPWNNGVAVADNKDSSTFAHELGHFLLDNNRFHLNPGDNFHSNTSDDLMHIPVNHPNPTAHKIQAEMFGLREPGLMVGNIGTTSHFGENVTPLGGAAAITQIEAIHQSPSVRNKTTPNAMTDNGRTHADRADFDWVEDNLFLDAQTTTGDNHPEVDNDALYWTTNPIAASNHTGHQHGNWGTLNLGRFPGDTFKTVDVVSQIARYTDMDVDSDGNWSARESALDYVLEFSADGVNWVAGKLHTVFQDGWTKKSKAEDFIGRWVSSVAAKFVKIVAAPLAGNHDGNTQIDAIIAAPDLPKIPRKKRLRDKSASGTNPNSENLPQISFDGLDSLSFSNVFAQSLLLDGGIPSIGDPLLGAEFLIGNTSLLETDDEGWLLSDSTFEMLFNGNSVLTADLTENFLFFGGGDHPEFDSEFQGVLDNISINNFLNSPFLNDLQAYLDDGGLTHLSFFSDIVSTTNNLTQSGSSSGIVWQDGTKVPESSSIFGILAVGGLGLMGLRKKRQ